MKKALFLSVICLLCSFFTQAQVVYSYDFTSSQGIYTPISDATLVADTITGENIQNLAIIAEDSTVSTLSVDSAFSIGFEFMFNNKAMHRFAIGTNMFLALGDTTVSVDPNRSAFIFTSENLGTQNIIGTPINSDYRVTDTTSISYKLDGIAPNRVLIVQYKALEFSSGSWGFEAVNMSPDLQIKLYETSNKIELIFHNWTRIDDGYSKSVRVGIKGDSEENTQLRSDSWTSSLKSTSDDVAWTTTNSPLDGLTYSFVPPAPCQTPTSQATNLVLSATTNVVNGSFVVAADADHYLVLQSIGEPTEVPTDGLTYSANDSIGNALILASNTEVSFETEEELLASTNYTYTIYATNAYCLDGPLYNITSPLTATIKTSPGAPVAFTSVANAQSTIELAASSLDASDEILIAESFVCGKDENGNTLNDGAFGQPTGLEVVGDQILGGGSVIYRGDASGLTSLSALPSNALYHFAAWTIDSFGAISTVALYDNALTWGEVPFSPNFETISSYNTPEGYTVEGDNFSLNYEKASGRKWIEFNVRNASEEVISNAITTPWILLGAEDNRLLIDYNAHVPGWWGRAGTPFNEWGENDTLFFQITTDGSTFTTLYSMQADNAPVLTDPDEFRALRLPITEYDGATIKLRVLWNTCSPATLWLDKIVVEEISSCDYPYNLTVDDLYLGHAKFSWFINSETAWEMRYRNVDSTTWRDTLNVASMPFEYDQFPSAQSLEVQVRALCSLTDQSAWSGSLFFDTGISLPYFQDFNENGEMPFSWTTMAGVLTADTTAFDSDDASSSVEDSTLTMIYANPNNQWVLMPKVFIPSSVNYQLEFDLKVEDGDDATAMLDDQVFQVVLSNEGVTNFTTSDVIFSITGVNGALEAVNGIQHYTVDLSPYSGVRCIGFYTTSSIIDRTVITIDNVAINATCSPATSIAVSEVTTDSALVSWEGTPTTYLLSYKEVGSTTPILSTVTGNSYQFSALSPGTSYEVGVAVICSANDTSAWVSQTFTTLSEVPCAEPIDVSVTATAYKVILSWEGDAANYELRLQLENSDTWITKETSENVYTFDNLAAETTYVYQIRSLCSAEDESVWTPEASITTLAVTCFVPENIVALPSYHSCAITWEGLSTSYLVNYKMAAESWQELNVTDTTVTLTNLIPEMDYSVRVKSICSQSDESTWSDPVEFTTEAIPNCEIPTNLQAEMLKDQVVALSWIADETNLLWNLKYRLGSATSWTTLSDLASTTLTLQELKGEEAYLWSVMAMCDEDRTSAWAAQETFTVESSAVISPESNHLNVFKTNGVINVVNRQGIQMVRLDIILLDGRVWGSYTLNTTDNVFIPTSLTNQTLLIRVQTTQGVEVYHIM